MTAINHADAFKGFFKGWADGKLGPKPTDEMLNNAVNLNCRPGKQAFAIAMMLRDVGATGSQIVMACGAPQLNKMRDLAADSYVKRVPTASDDRGHTVYRLEVTPKGKQRIERNVSAQAKADAAGEADTAKPKVAKKPKAKKAKGETKAKPAVKAADAAPQPVIEADGSALNLPDISPVNADLTVNG